MRRDQPLNEVQQKVLRWVGDGCPTGVMQGHSYKRTARALQDRRLVTVRRGPEGWSAELADAGRYYLEHGEFPEQTGQHRRPSPRSPAPTSTEKPSPVNATAEHETQPRPAATEEAPKRGPRVSPTEQLVADVVAAGGVLDVEEEHFQRRGGRDALVAAANRFSKTPPGKRLVERRVPDPRGFLYRGRSQLVLVDGPAGTNEELQPVPVPERVNRYHPAVVALRETGTPKVSAAVQSRAWRVLHSVATEAGRRGAEVAAAEPPSRDGDRRLRPEVWHLVLTIGGEQVRVRLSEEYDRVPHEPTARELAEKQRYSWTRIPTHDSVASGRLRLELENDARSGRRRSWTDRASWRLEDKLPEVLRETAVRADELRLAREARAAAQARHTEAVAAEEDRARIRATEHHRAEVLDGQLAAWRETRELRAFAEDLAAHITTAEQDNEASANDVQGARAWLAWIEDRAAARDPFGPLPVLPAAPELRRGELDKFMRRIPPPPAEF